ncbi:unnamed protein product, partial [marine sediment metagenome]
MSRRQRRKRWHAEGLYHVATGRPEARPPVVEESTDLATQPEAYDLLIAGGRVLDPGQGIDGLLDVAVTGGHIARVEERIDKAGAGRVLDATGLLITPGLIDLHTHVAAGLGGLPADR